MKSQNFLPTKHKDIVPAKIGDIIRFARQSKASFHNLNETEGISVDLPNVSKSLKPEDDILYKWRLSRKMDLASKTASATSNPFLNYSEANKYISMQKQELLIDQNQDVVEKSKEYLSKNLETTSKKEIDSTEICDNKTSNEKVSDSIESSSHVCCKKETMQGCKTKTCLEREDNLSTCTSFKCHHAGSSSSNISCACKSLDHGQIYCNCHKLSHLCDMYSYHIPPHVHNACDILPCMHKKLPNLTSCAFKSQQNDDEDVLDVKNMSLEKEPTKQRGVAAAKKKPEDTKVSSSKNGISPVINQVIDYFYI